MAIQPRCCWLCAERSRRAFLGSRARQATQTNQRDRALFLTLTHFLFFVFRFRGRPTSKQNGPRPRQAACLKNQKLQNRRPPWIPAVLAPLLPLHPPPWVSPAAAARLDACVQSTPLPSFSFLSSPCFGWLVSHARTHTPDASQTQRAHPSSSIYCSFLVVVLFRVSLFFHPNNRLVSSLLGPLLVVFQVRQLCFFLFWWWWWCAWC